MSNRRPILALFGAVCGLLIALWFVRPGAQAGEAFLQPVGPLLPQPFDPPAFRLLDAGGDTVRLADLRGAPAALFFGYTSCPDVCPITLARLVAEREERGLAPEAFQIVFVTMDPSRDTPERLRRFAAGFGGGIETWWEEEAELYRQANLLGVQAVKGPPSDPDDPDSYLVEHTARTFLLDDRGRIVAALPPMPEPAEVEATLDAVLDLVEENRGG